MRDHLEFPLTSSTMIGVYRTIGLIKQPGSPSFN